ncbi:MAG: addiction module protein [Alphaproteobacteria bacterium HGW-Alphaproteobacteria-16]|nr:MAG: addiction module protein [Alphaproteobacteria bacterium HGW-Alphaproteobacteria-16]
MTFDAATPYNELPPLPPATILETTAVLKACISARAALAELKAIGDVLPNQSILINSIPLLEAQASSEIENIVTTGDRLFQFAGTPSDAGIDPATKETLRYRTALANGSARLAEHPLSTRTAVEICCTIKGADMDVRRTPGTTLANDRTGAVIYTPPQGEQLLRDMLSNWERYIHDHGEVDPLVALAVQHYQFEAIHPFTDGNGRTGRVLNLLFLIQHGLLDIPVLYLSRAIIRRKSEYYRLLLDVTVRGQWEPWLLFMIDAVAETAGWTSRKVRAIRSLLDETAQTMRSKAPRIYSRELAELIFSQPYCRIGNVVDAGLAKRQAASTNLKALVSIGLLEERKSGRERLFVNPPLLDLLMVEEG